MVCIYKITNPNGSIYIGQTKNYKSRIRSYRNLGCKSQRRLYNSFLKHGFDNHVIEIIEKCKEEELIEREEYWIMFYDSFNNGMNLNSGGLCHKVSDETKAIMSKKRKENPKGCVGNKGEAHYNWGKKATEEQRKAMSDAKKGLRMGVKNNKFKGYVTAFKDGVLVGRYEGVTAAARALNLHHPNISKVLLGKYKHTNKYTFTREDI